MEKSKVIENLKRTERYMGMPEQGCKWTPNASTIAIEEAINSLEKLSRYEATGLKPEEVEELKEKQIPKNVPDIEHFGRCPECDGEFNSELLNEYNIMFCPWCGQALDWTES